MEVLRDYLNGWLARQRLSNALAAKAADRFQQLIDLNIAPALGDRPIGKLDPEAVEDFYAKMLSEGRQDGAGGLSTTNVRQMHALLVRALNDACRLRKLHSSCRSLPLRSRWIGAGKHKLEANPVQPLSGSARAHIQSLVDAKHEKFPKAVARGRGVTSSLVKIGFGEGRIVDAETALALGMVDDIATLDEVLARRPEQTHQPRRRAASLPPFRFGAW